MDNGLILRRFHLVRIEQQLSFVGILIVALALYLFANPYGSYLSIFSRPNEGLTSLNNAIKASSSNSKVANLDIIRDHKSDKDDALSSDMKELNLNEGSMSQREGYVNSHKSAKTGPFRGVINISTGKECGGLGLNEQRGSSKMNFAGSNDQEASGCNQHKIAGEQIDPAPLDPKVGSGKSVLPVATNLSLVNNNENKVRDSDSIKSGSSHISVMASNIPPRNRRGKVIPIAHMNLLLLNNYVGVKSKRPWRSSVRDRELHDAKFQIENAPMQRNISEVHSSIFRNYSMFKSS